ncbi:hypothetical protein AX17_006768 [Amanita inopinata Kibby_2008]|nr:hypothetical protein AX17_006768 [Amanita inopinata Kibby_2008]
MSSSLTVTEQSRPPTPRSGRTHKGRKENKKKFAEQKLESQTRPSSSNDRSYSGGDAGNEAGEAKNAVIGTFEKGEDFIALLPSEDSDHGSQSKSTVARKDETAEGRKDKGKGREVSPSTREWDRGKVRDDDDRQHGKRRYDMIFDFNDGYSNKRQRVDANSRKAPWLERFDWESCKNVAEMLHREVKAFVDWVSPTPEEDEVRGLVVALVSRAVTQAFPDAQVFPFGSYETKLYLPLGDIDLVVISQSMAYSDKTSVLYALANALKRAGITPKVSIIAKAKVPIVKFVTTHGRFNVDISINQQNGMVSGNIIKGFLKDMHFGGSSRDDSLALRSLILITKAFLGQRSMNEVFTGGLGSYSIVCLAISFLQMHPKIRRGEIDPDKNLGVLVMEYFELYGCYFNYDEVGISVRNGGMYFKKRQRGWIDFQRGRLSIEDPADPSNDISRGSFGFQRVRMTLAGAYEILTSTAYLRAGMLNARYNSRSFSLRDHYEAQDMSILSSIMGVTQETINHRKLVQEVYDSRVLHNLVGINPKPTIVQAAVVTNTNGGRPRPPSSSQSGIAQKAVRAAWKEAEEGAISDYDASHKRRSLAAYEDEDEDDEGRYHIGRQRPPPHKRRRTGKAADLHTVFTTDDDAEGSLFSRGESETEEGEYLESTQKGHRGRQQEGGEAESRRRSYWLSKGIGIPGGEAESE